MLPGIRRVAALMQSERFRGSLLSFSLPRRWPDYPVRPGPRPVGPFAQLSVLLGIGSVTALLQPEGFRVTVLVFRQQ